MAVEGLDNADGQIIVPKWLKTSPLEQHKKIEFCKFHNFMGHKTSHSIIFGDSVQRALDEGRLKFADKAKYPVQVGFDPLQINDAIYAESLECLMVEATESPDVEMEVSESNYVKKVKAVYPTTKEEHADLLNRVKLKSS